MSKILNTNQSKNRPMRLEVGRFYVHRTGTYAKIMAEAMPKVTNAFVMADTTDGKSFHKVELIATFRTQGWQEIEYDEWLAKLDEYCQK